MEIIRKELGTERKWQKLLQAIGYELGKKPSGINAVLFLIGVQELGIGPQDFSKEQKQDLIHIAICKVLSLAGFYELEGIDQEGWPHWKLVKKLPRFDPTEQEKLLKMQVIAYFNQELNLYV